MHDFLLFVYANLRQDSCNESLHETLLKRTVCYNSHRPASMPFVASSKEILSMFIEENQSHLCYSSLQVVS